MVDELHAAGVKVLLPYNPWDHGTRRGECDDACLLDTLIKDVNADGFNGDTMGSIPQEFYTESLNLSHPIALEPEGGGGGATIAWDTMGWGYWGYAQVVAVDRWKWLDPRRLTNICERWSKDHTNALQYALFNGDGFESWENVWGTWNGITPRDAEATRRVGSLLRFLGGRGYLQSQGWVPHTMTLAPGKLFASLWPLKDGTAAWTIVNRDAAASNHTGPAVSTRTLPKGYATHDARGAPLHFYDLYHGVEVKPDGAGAISVSVEAGGFGAVLATAATPSTDAGLAALMKTMAAMTSTALASYTPVWTFLQQQKVPIARTTPWATTPPGMAMIPGGQYRFEVKGVMIEGADSSLYNNVYGVDVQQPFEPHPRRFHVQIVNMSPFLMDKQPVTQADYAKFLDANPAALPSDTWHYLKNWDWANPAKPAPHPGNMSVPVTYVGIAEARAYCAWANKRLPGEIEWQCVQKAAAN